MVKLLGSIKAPVLGGGGGVGVSLRGINYSFSEFSEQKASIYSRQGLARELILAI